MCFRMKNDSSPRLCGVGHGPIATATEAKRDHSVDRTRDEAALGVPSA